MRLAARTGALAAAALLVLGCSSRFESFPFQTLEGARIDLRQSERRARTEEATFLPTPSKPASPVYRLARPVAAPAGLGAFALSYTSSIGDCRLTIFSEKGAALKSVALPASSGTRLRFLVPLAHGDRIWGFQLSAGSPDMEGASLQLLGAGTTGMVHGFAIDPDGLTVDGSVSVLSASPSAMSARISSATREEMAKGIWVISLRLQPGAAGGRVTFQDPKGASASFDVDPSSTLSRIDFSRGSLGFLPRSINFTGSLASLQIGEIPVIAPLPVDPGLILTWDTASWRRPDFEIYSWTRFPAVLILDTASYAVQDSLFKRLAFFVEKAGHAGRIETPSALAGIHGYNAHDYKADDLARFFSVAEKQGIRLSPEEEELSGLLLENGVIKKGDPGYEPGEGCVISISRSSSAVLRDLLLTHECFHGAFFTLPEFRKATGEAWSSLAPLEQQVWKAFLASKAYDTTDQYLVVNEFQGYLMQQERSEVPGFQATTLARMRLSSSLGAGLVSRLLAERPDSFLRAFDALDKALRAAGGLPGGLALSVRRVK